jgi:signal peptidase II
MGSNVARRALILAVALVGLVGIDQAAKKAVEAYLPWGDMVEVVGDTFILTRADNRGAFLSLGAELDEPAHTAFIIALPLALTLVCGIWGVFGKNGRLAFAGLLLVCAGGAGNLFDRIVRGSVIDFMQFDLGFIRTGVLNIADLYITVGVLIVVGALTAEEVSHKRAVSFAQLPQVGLPGADATGPESGEVSSGEGSLNDGASNKEALAGSEAPSVGRAEADPTGPSGTAGSLGGEDGDSAKDVDKT